jgi:hypothetical protein
MSPSCQGAQEQRWPTWDLISSRCLSGNFALATRGDVQAGDRHEVTDAGAVVEVGRAKRWVATIKSYPGINGSTPADIGKGFYAASRLALRFLTIAMSAEP